MYLNYGVVAVLGLFNTHNTGKVMIVLGTFLNLSVLIV